MERGHVGPIVILLVGVVSALVKAVNRVWEVNVDEVTVNIDDEGVIHLWTSDDAGYSLTEVTVHEYAHSQSHCILILSFFLLVDPVVPLVKPTVNDQKSTDSDSA